MEYRFVCILNNTTSNRNIDIEVCMETGSRSLSPFQRKVNGDDKENLSGEKFIYQIFEHGGKI